MVAPRVLSVQASIYLNPQIVVQSRMIAKQEGLSEADVQKQILAELAEGTVYAFEQMLNEKFHRLVQESYTYRVQQMSPKKRRDHLSKFHPVHSEAEYMEEKFPEGPNMTLEDFLDFEAALVVRVSRARIMKDLQGIKDRLVMRVLVDIFASTDDNLVSTDSIWIGAGPGWSPNEIMRVMSQLGLITRDELQEYVRSAGTKRGRQRVLHKLWTTYYEGAWHKKYEKTPVVKA